LGIVPRCWVFVLRVAAAAKRQAGLGRLFSVAAGDKATSCGAAAERQAGLGRLFSARGPLVENEGTSDRAGGRR